MDEVLGAFLEECYENQEKLDNEFVFFEKMPSGSHVKDSLARVFRTVHTIKGSCGWLGLAKLEAVVYYDGKELLLSLREDTIPLTAAIVSAQIISKLGESSGEIAKVIRVIMSIAQRPLKPFNQIRNQQSLQLARSKVS